MWILQSISNSEKTYYLLPGKEYIVGKRKEAYILIENDQSVSRKHAIVRVGKTEHSNVPISVEDVSKYGTSVNSVKILSQTLLSDGDEITFGIFKNKYRLKSFHIVVTSSSITNAAEKRSVQDAIAALGGHCIPQWHEKCTHLVMEKFFLTIKAVCALASAKPIVKPNYLWAWWKSLEQNNPPPDIKSFIPPMEEECLKNKNIEITVCEARKSLFHNKTFLFVSPKQFTSLEQIIRLAGGEAELILKADENQLLSRNCLVVAYPPGTSQTKECVLASKLDAILKKHSKRSIHETEIGFAVVFNSIAKYCNPDFIYDLNEIDESTMETETQPDFTSSRILVTETQTDLSTQVVDDAAAANTSAELFCSDVSEMMSVKEDPETQITDIKPLDDRGKNKKRLLSNDSPVHRKLPRLEPDTVNDVEMPDVEKRPVVVKSPDLFENCSPKSVDGMNGSCASKISVCDIEQERPRMETNHVWLCTKENDNNSSEQQIVVHFKPIPERRVLQSNDTLVSDITITDSTGVNFKNFKKFQTFSVERRRIRPIEYDAFLTGHNSTMKEFLPQGKRRQKKPDENPFITTNASENQDEDSSLQHSPKATNSQMRPQQNKRRKKTDDDENPFK